MIGLLSTAEKLTDTKEMNTMQIRKGTTLIPGIVALILTAVLESAFGWTTTTTFNSADVPKPTVDNGTITSTITVPVCSGTITDVNVQIDVDHDYLGALDIFLITPDGTEVELTTDNGEQAPWSGSYGGTIFDDEAGASITTGFTPFSGSYQPEGPLSVLDGKAAEGIWTLRVTDDDLTVPADTGVLNSWSLIIETSSIITQSATDVPVPTIDNATVTSTINVPCSGTITDVNVQVDIAHTRLEDLDIFLIAPDSGRVKLSTNQSGGDSSYNGTIFDDEAAISINAGSVPYSGSYQPEGSLSALDGKKTAGSWTLEVTDDGPTLPVDTGAINAWTLIIDTSYDATDVPQAIPDNALSNPVESTITLPNLQGKIADVNVQIDITHPYVADLDIFLTAPNGSRIELTTDNGQSGADFSGTIFDDDAATSITAVTNLDAPFSGSYQPEQPLAALNGLKPVGDWTLEVGDDTGGDTGTLNAWSLMIELQSGSVLWMVIPAAIHNP